MSAFTKLLGPTLLKGDGKVPTEEALAGKTAVGIYFSAHWCPPCRGFTPQLAKAYEASLKAKGLEIVFVSSDKSEGEFASYYGKEQPWLAVPFENRDVKNALSKKYKVRGIPSFVILDGATGETITTDGREAVSEDWTGQKFPWRPPTFWDCLGSEFLQGTDGETVDLDELKSSCKTIGLYFSAHWCPPCRQFTPMLIKSYTESLKAKGLEIIFVSSDRDAASFQEYYGTMPWLAIPNGDPRKGTLSKLFGVEGIPSFALIDAQTGETINADGRGRIMSDPSGAEFPWHPKALNDLDSPDGINEEAALIVLLEKCDEATTAAATATLTPLAEASKAAKEELLWFVGSKEGQIAEKVRALTNLGAATAGKPQMILLDIPDDGGYYVAPDGPVTAESVTAFLKAYKEKSPALERKQLG